MEKRLLILVSFLLGCLVGTEAWGIHDDPSKGRCLDCHVFLPLQGSIRSYHENIAAICFKCHEKGHSENGLSHPVSVTPSMKVPVDMPLDRVGKLTCITCHRYHPRAQQSDQSPPKLLRRPPGRDFCLYCHTKL